MDELSEEIKLQNDTDCKGCDYFKYKSDTNTYVCVSDQGCHENYGGN